MGPNFEMYSMYHNTDANTIGITTPVGLVEEEYAVGENFLKYLNLNFQSYNEFYKIYEDFHLASLLKEQRNIKVKERLFVESCKEIYSSWENEIADKIEWYKDEFNKIKKANSFEGLKKLNVLNNIFLRVLKVSTSSKHPYIRHSLMPFERDLDIKKYQDMFKQLVDFCFNKDYSPELNNLSAWERYYLWQIKKGTFNNLAVIEFFEPTIECSYALLSKENLLFNNKQAMIDSELNNKTIKSLKSLEAFPIRLNHCKTPTEYAFCEFHAMLDLNIKIKHCDYCGNYFILSGNYHTKYCSNCKKEAIKSARRSKVESSPILKEYEKAYKRMYARRLKGNLSNKEFGLWTEKTSAKRDIFNEKYTASPSEDLLQEFKDFLENK